MKLYGLQKMTLLDFPGHVACTVFLSGCGLRCPFCHNFELAEGKAPAVMEDGEFLSFLGKRKGLLDGVAVTGGEPCLSPGLPDFLSEIKKLGFAVKLDTNGFHPDALGEILGAGLADYVAMDIKNSPEKYAVTSGRETLDLTPVYESISLIMGSGIPYEFRTTVVRELHEPEDFRGAGQMVRGAERFFLQAFTDRDTVPFAGFHAPEKEMLQKSAEILRNYVNRVELRGVD